MRTGFVTLLLCGWLVGCAALRDDMRRAESAFDQARYEDVEVWLTDLEPDVAEMDRPMRARFYYVRGMTAFRLGDKRRARHYLALSREEAGPHFVGLRSEWRTTLEGTLEELDTPRAAPLKTATAAPASGAVDDEKPPALQP